AAGPQAAPAGAAPPAAPGRLTAAAQRVERVRIARSAGPERRFHHERRVLVHHPTSSADTSGTGPAAADVIAQLRAALGAVDDATLVGLAPDAEQRVLPAGAILFREGDPSDAMYVVVRGELHATIRSAERGETVVGRIGPGETVGEMQILSGGLRT